MPIDKTAVVQELYSRIGTLPPDKAAIVQELAARLGVGPSLQGEANKARQTALANTSEYMKGDEEPTSGGFIQSAENALQSINPVAIAKNYVARMNDPIGHATGLPGGGVEDVPGVTQAVHAGQQLANGNMAGAAGTAVGSVAAGAALGTAVKSAPVASDLAANIAKGTPGAVKSALPIAARGAAALGAAQIPVVGHAIAGAIMYDGLHAMTRGVSARTVANSIIKSIYGPAKPAATPTPTSTPAAEPSPIILTNSAGKGPRPVSTDISTTPEVSPKISVNSASSAMGTTPNTLSQDTHARLATAANDNTLIGLPSVGKEVLVNAVKAGDDVAVNRILNDHRQIQVVRDNIENKLKVLHNYVQKNGIDLDSIPPEQRQAFANAAMDHAKAQGGFTLPQGKYRGISDDTWNELKTRLSLID